MVIIYIGGLNYVCNILLFSLHIKGSKMKIEKPARVIRTYTQKINGTAAQVFPLLCPVREADWIDGWDPEIVYSNSGAAEQDCIFITSIGDKKTTWIMNRYEPENNYVEIIRYTENLLVVKLAIKLHESAGKTEAEITFYYNAINKAGEKELEKITEEYYKAFMKEWEDNMNHYLLTGKMKKEA
jgi:hypothetical protein